MLHHKTFFINRAAVPRTSIRYGIRVNSSSPECPVFMSPDGKVIQPMCSDYGFRSGAQRLGVVDGEVPTGVWSLAKSNFNKELESLRLYVRHESKAEDLSVTAEGAKLNFVQAALSTVGDATTSLLAKADVFLEENKVLPELQKPAARSDMDSDEWMEIRAKLLELKLSNAAVVEQERKRERVEGELETPLWVKAPFLALCFVLDVLYDNKVSQCQSWTSHPLDSS